MLSPLATPDAMMPLFAAAITMLFSLRVYMRLLTYYAECGAAAADIFAVDVYFAMLFRHYAG